MYLWVSLWKQSPFTPVECQDSPQSLVYIQQVVAAISDPTQPASRGAGISGGGLTMSPDTERRHTHTPHITQLSGHSTTTQTPSDCLHTHHSALIRPSSRHPTMGSSITCRVKNISEKKGSEQNKCPYVIITHCTLLTSTGKSWNCYNITDETYHQRNMVAAAEVLKDIYTFIYSLLPLPPPYLYTHSLKIYFLTYLLDPHCAASHRCKLIWTVHLDFYAYVKNIVFV